MGRGEKIEDGAERRNGKVEGRKAGSSSKEFIPPDGGYGWVIVFASGMTNFSILALIQNFGLLYKESLKTWGITTAEYSVMVNLQFSICNCVGLIMGPLLRAHGYRKVTLGGSVLVCLSSVLTSQVNKFYLFLITYSIIGGAGVGFVWSSTSLAINTYFKNRRGVATGFAWAATGLSPVIFPHLLTWLRTEFDVHGTVLIAAGIMMHSIPASMLLHPVEWHAEFRTTEAGVEKENAAMPTTTPGDADQESRKLMESPAAEFGDRHCREEPIGTQEVGGSRRPSFRKRHSLPHSVRGGEILVDSQDTLGLDVATPISLHSSRMSLDKAGASNLRRTAAHSDFVEALVEAKREMDVEDVDSSEVPSEKKEPQKKESIFRLYLKRVVDYFDLGLLSDFRFLMIFIGMTLAYCGEINFSLLASFIFLDYGFPLESVAILMSTLAFVDLVTRFTVPFFSDHFKLDSRAMYAVGLLLLGIGRIMLAHLDGYITILCVSAWLGLGKGFRTIYMALVLPSTVPLEKLASASGLQTLANGIIFLVIGPLFGYIRDNSDSYLGVLYALDLFTFSAILVWGFEVLYTRNRKRKEVENKNPKEIMAC